MPSVLGRPYLHPARILPAGVHLPAGVPAAFFPMPGPDLPQTPNRPSNKRWPVPLQSRMPGPIPAAFSQGMSRPPPRLQGWRAYLSSSGLLRMPSYPRNPPQAKMSGCASFAFWSRMSPSLLRRGFPTAAGSLPGLFPPQYPPERNPLGSVSFAFFPSPGPYLRKPQAASIPSGCRQDLFQGFLPEASPLWSLPRMQPHFSGFSSFLREERYPRPLYFQKQTATVPYPPPGVPPSREPFYQSLSTIFARFSLSH